MASERPPTPTGRTQRLMQDALDDRLTPEALQDLHTRLDSDPHQAEAFQRLRDVDRAFRNPPLERAPKTLALKIMARLAEGLDVARLRQNGGLALAVAIALVTLALTPLLAGFGWLLVNTVGDAGALNGILRGMASVLSVVVASLGGLLTSARGVVESSPAVPLALVALIPIGMVALRRIQRASREAARPRPSRLAVEDAPAETPTQADVAASERRDFSRLERKD